MKTINDTLRNGYRIVAIHRSTRGAGVVLAENGKQYATWLFNCNPVKFDNLDEDTDFTYAGKYFMESNEIANDVVGEAMQNYIRRIDLEELK